MATPSEYEELARWASGYANYAPIDFNQAQAFARVAAILRTLPGMFEALQAADAALYAAGGTLDQADGNIYTEARLKIRAVLEKAGISPDAP